MLLHYLKHKVIIRITGLISVLILSISIGLVSLDKIDNENLIFPILNFFGASLLLIYAAYKKNLNFIVFSILIIFISAAAILKIFN